MFKWDKFQVDALPVEYVVDTIFISMEMISDIFKGLGSK